MCVVFFLWRGLEVTQLSERGKGVGLGWGGGKRVVIVCWGRGIVFQAEEPARAKSSVLRKTKP